MKPRSAFLGPLAAALFSCPLMAAEPSHSPPPSNNVDEDRDEADTLQTRFFRGHSLDVGGFGGVTTKYSRIMDHDTSVVGVRGALLLDHRYIVGAGAYGIAGSLAVPNDPLKQDLAMGYAVIMLGYSIAPRKLVHVNLVGNFGGGGAVLTKPEPKTDASTDKTTDDENHKSTSSRTDLMTVVEPEILVEINVTSYLRVDLGLGYRYVGGLKLDPVSPAQVRGWTPTISIIGGKF